MPKNKKSPTAHRTHSPRRLSVRGVLRKSPDLDKIASTIEALAIAQAEKEARASAEAESEARS